MSLCLSVPLSVCLSICLSVFMSAPTGIFLENNLKYQNAHNISLAGPFLPIAGAFSLYNFYYLTYSGREWPLVLGLMGHFKF